MKLVQKCLKPVFCVVTNRGRLLWWFLQKSIESDSTSHFITSVNIQEFMSQSLVSSLLQTAEVHFVNYANLESNRPKSTGCVGGGYYSVIGCRWQVLVLVPSSSQSGSTPCSSKYGYFWFQGTKMALNKKSKWGFRAAAHHPACDVTLGWYLSSTLLWKSPAQHFTNSITHKVTTEKWIHTLQVKVIFSRQVLMFSFVFLTLIITYLKVLFAARTVSGSYRASARNARNTILLHGVQLFICMLSYLSPFINIALVTTWPNDRTTILFVTFLFTNVLPRLLSPLIYGVRDKKFNSHIRQHFCCRCCNTGENKVVEPRRRSKQVLRWTTLKMVLKCWTCSDDVKTSRFFQGLKATFGFFLRTNVSDLVTSSGEDADDKKLKFTPLQTCRRNFDPRGDLRSKTGTTSC